MLNDIYFQIDLGKNIAKKYEVTEGRISQIKHRFLKLKYKPKIKDNKLVCYLCKNPNHLVFHHRERTGEQIAILCFNCNTRVKQEDNLEKVKVNDKQKILNEIEEDFKEIHLQLREIVGKIERLIYKLKYF